MKRPILMLFVVACGGADPAPTTPARPPPSEVLAMTVRVLHQGGNDNFCPALEMGLARSGITVSGDASQPTDATIACHVYASEDVGYFRIVQNGESRMRYTVRVDVRSAQNAPVDQFVVEYKGFRNAPDDDAVSKVVLAYAYSPRIAAFARTAKSQIPAAATTETQPVATVMQPRDSRDDAMWFAIDTVKCKIPARVEACNQVRYYLQRFPNGAHAQEAGEILTAAQPALEKLQKDEVAWQKSNHFECSRLRTSDACVGVEAYDMQFPTGLHSDEAKRYLKYAGH